MFVDVELAVDEPDIDHCGKCTKCIDACPTEAIIESRQVDSNKCIAYHTIENRGLIDPGLSSKFGTWMAGCDVCQRVCPWNEPAQGKSIDETIHFERDNSAFGVSFAELLQWDLKKFKVETKDIAMNRMKYHGFLRNLGIATFNSKLPVEQKKAVLEKIREHSQQIENKEYRNIVLETLESLS